MTDTVNIRLRPDLADLVAARASKHKRASMNALVNDIVAQVLTGEQLHWMPPGLMPIADVLVESIGTDQYWVIRSRSSQVQSSAVIDGSAVWHPAVRTSAQPVEVVIGRITRGNETFIEVNPVGVFGDVKIIDRVNLMSWYKLIEREEDEKEVKDLQEVIGSSRADWFFTSRVMAARRELLANGVVKQYGAWMNMPHLQLTPIEDAMFIQKYAEAAQAGGDGTPEIVCIPFCAHDGRPDAMPWDGSVDTATHLEVKDFVGRLIGVRLRIDKVDVPSYRAALTEVKIGGSPDLLGTQKDGMWEERSVELGEEWVEITDLSATPILIYPNQAFLRVQCQSFPGDKPKKLPLLHAEAILERMAPLARPTETDAFEPKLR